MPKSTRASQAGHVALNAAMLSATALTAKADPFFDRVATFAVRDNLSPEQAADKEHEAVVEIISASAGGMILAYTDAPGRRVGLVDLADPANPKPLGTGDAVA